MSYKRNYKFKPGDRVKVWNLIGWEEDYEIFVTYHTDLENHVAEPHNRCVIIYVGKYKANRDIDDVCERELEFQGVE